MLSVGSGEDDLERRRVQLQERRRILDRCPVERSSALALADRQRIKLLDR